MTTLWTAAELRAATGGTLAHDVAVTGASIDTRSIAPGDLFIALRDVRDGHDFVGDALARGAAAALVDRDPPGVAPDAPIDAAMPGELPQEQPPAAAGPQAIAQAPEDAVLSGFDLLLPDAEDAPDVLEGETIDVSAYVVEHLALEIDPFPKKPGAGFVQLSARAGRTPTSFSATSGS